MAGDSYRRIESVKKTTDVLKFLAKERRLLTGSEVAEGVGLPTGTALCHLITLADAGFVRQVGEGWELGIGLALIWARVKANIEGKINTLQSELKALEVDDVTK